MTLDDIKIHCFVGIVKSVTWSVPIHNKSDPGMHCEPA